MAIKALDLMPGARCNWIDHPERLVFMGRKLYPDGMWYQFAKVETPDTCWSEVRVHQLVDFEFTKEE